MIIERFRQRMYIKFPHLYQAIDSTLQQIEKEAELLNNIMNCQDCTLHQTCHKKVPGIGPIPADIMFVGEFPDYVEDQCGMPFVGPPGQLLERAIQAVGWHRDEIYMTYAVKCKPNKELQLNPEDVNNEIVACYRHIHQEVEMVNPKVVVCWGEIPSRILAIPDFNMQEHATKWFMSDRVYIGLPSPSYILQCVGTDLEYPVKQQVFETLLKIKQYQQSGFQQVPEEVFA